MKKVALLIGVSEYSEQEGLKPLPSAEADVDALYRVLVDPERGEFLAENVTVLKNPDLQQMANQIFWLFHDRHKDDLLLFYFSGHGIKDDRNNLYLGTRITCKHKGSLFTPSALPATTLHKEIEASRSQHQVIILDACFSGAIAQGMTVKDDGIVKLEDYLGGKGRAILTSSTATEYSFGAEPTEHGDLGLSIYTRYLVEGIATGAADLDEDDWISVDELHEYASKKVKQAAPAMTPKFYPVEEGYKIRLSKSRRNDSKLKYEREFQRQVEKDRGNLSIVVTRMLIRKQTEWRISPAEAKTIEDRVLQPYREYWEKLAEYEQTLTEEMQRKYPFSVKIQADLKEYKQYLKLRYEDIAEIHRRVLPLDLKKHQQYLDLLNEDILDFLDEDVSEIHQQILPQFILTSPDLNIGKTDGLPKLSIIEFTSVKVNAQGEIIDRPKGEAKIFVEDLGNGISLTMVKIPGGEFTMGSPASEEGRSDDESPQHRVKVPEFYLGQTLVTQAQWQQMMGNNPSKFTGDGKLPVERVSWLDTQEFCQKLFQQTQREYRLPSEAEWEYACRAGTTTPYYFGGTITDKLANYHSQRKKTTSVYEFPPNAFGLYDLHGNISEFCLDHSHENYQGAPLDGSAWLSDDDKASRIMRGGYWGEIPRYCRSASREAFTPVNRINIIGFRVVCEIPRT
jgi:formylglycine-generating enzyme required for sulfatase activity/uncharacterized caspase-like protein